MTLASDAVHRAAARGVTIATAESLTGGLVAAALTSVPGSSAVVRGGVVSYATDVKVSLLGVPESVVASHGVVSAECAQAMAAGVRERLGATYGLATTGVAGPTEQEGHPVGTVFLGLAGPRGSEVVSLSLSGSRDSIRSETVEAVLEFLLDRVLRREEPAVG